MLQFNAPEVSLKKRIKCFQSILRWRNSKTQQSLIILDLCFRKIRSGKSRGYRDAIVFEKLRFRDGLVWMVGLTVEIKLRFQFSLV